MEGCRIILKLMDAAEDAMAMGIAKMADAKALPGKLFSVNREVMMPIARPPTVTKSTKRTVTQMLFQNSPLREPNRMSE